MADTVWHRIDRELARRREARLLPGSWAQLGRAVGQSNQTLTNWKTRGVPPKHYQDLAAVFDWSVDQLLGADDGAPQSPGPKFTDRRGKVSESDWGLLEDIKTAGDLWEHRAAQIAEIRAEVAKFKALAAEMADKMVKEKLGTAPRGPKLAASAPPDSGPIKGIPDIDAEVDASRQTGGRRERHKD